MKNDKFDDKDYTPRWGPGDRRTKKIPKVNKEPKEVTDMNGIKAIDKSYRKEYLAPVNKAMAEEEYYRIQLYKMFPVQALSDDLDKSYSHTSYTNVDALIQFHKSSFGYTVQKTYELLSKGMQSFQKALWTPPTGRGAGGATSHPASTAGLAATEAAAKASGSFKPATATAPQVIKQNNSMQGQAGLNEAHQNLAAMNRAGIISEHLNPGEKETRSVGEQMHWKGQHGVSDSRAMNIGLANNGTGPAWNSKEGATPILKINDHEGHEQIFAHHEKYGWLPSSGISMDKNTGKDVVGFHSGKQSDYHQSIMNHLNTFVPGHLFRDTNHHDQVANLNLAKDSGHDEFHAHGVDSANNLDKVTKLHEDLKTNGREYMDPVKGKVTEKPVKVGTNGSEGFMNRVESKGLTEQGDTNMKHVQTIESGLPSSTAKTPDDANKFFNGRGKKAGKKRIKTNWEGDVTNHADKSAYGTY